MKEETLTVSDTWRITPIERKMLEVLSDGMNHSRKELHACCGPSSLSAVRKHISRLRPYLDSRGEDIVCVFTGRTICYRHVRNINRPYDQ